MTRSFEVLVREYKALHQRRITDEIGFYASLELYPALALSKAVEAQGPDGKRHGHQYHIGPEQILHVKSSLMLSDVSAHAVGCEPFDCLHDYLWARYGSVDGIGPLYIYDLALRLGASLGFKPTKVYLHAGTARGAKAFGIKGATASPTQFPEALDELEPYEIENFLCIYEVELHALKDRGRLPLRRE